MPTQAMQAIFMWMEIQKEIVLQEKLLAAGLYITWDSQWGGSPLIPAREFW